MSIASPARAGVWGTQPVLGVSGDYSTNPGLLYQPNTDTAETHAALLVDAPTTYVGDAFKLSILPSFRLSDSRGYSQLDSDYEHLNVSGEFDTERSVFTATGALARDSTLYHDYLLNGSTAGRRDSASADLNWDRKLTERVEIDTDVLSTRVRFAEPVGTATLTDYKYTSITPTLAWNESERGKLTLAASVGRYNSLDGLTESTNGNLQVGYVKQLSEIWSLSASAGYSRANNRADTREEVLEFTPEGPIIVLIPITVKSTQNGSVYNVTLSRQSALLLVTASASRQLAPTGFAFLSRQDNYELKATYNQSPRWTFAGDVHRITYQQPNTSGPSTNLNVTYLQLSAAWLWTEHWTVTMNATRVMERYSSPSTISVSASGVSIELSRQFNWKSLQ
ncbi:MAG: hypothetical protein ACLP2F_08475 [Steroidobacteraceae bacterium]